MYLRINPVDVAGGALGAMGLALKNENAVLSLGYMRPVESETKLDRHVKPRHAARQLDAG